MVRDCSRAGYIGARIRFVCSLLAATAAALTSVPSTARADVLTFEDLTGVVNFFTAPYKGFSFGDNSVDTNPWFHTRQVSPYYKPKSGIRYVATDYQLYRELPLEPTLPITSNVDFVFDGAWFTGGATVQFKLYRDGALVFTSAESRELDAVPVFLASGYRGLVDSVVVLGTQGYYAMDDFTFNSTPVPETGTAGLMLAGLAGLALSVSLVRLRASDG